MQEDNGCKILPRVVDAQEIVHGGRGCPARQCRKPHLRARPPHGGPTAMRTMAASRRHDTGCKECKNQRLAERGRSSPNPMQGGADKSCRCAPAQRRGARAPRDAAKRAPPPGRSGEGPRAATMRKPCATEIRSQHENLRTGRAVGVPGAFGGRRRPRNIYCILY